MSDPSDPYRAWLVLRPEEDRNHYRLLGIALFEERPEVIVAAAQKRMAHVEKFLGGERADHARQVLDQLAAAKACLLAPQQKAAYDEGIRRELGPSGDRPPASLAAMLLPIGLGVILVFGLVWWGSRWSGRREPAQAPVSASVPMAQPPAQVPAIAPAGPAPAPAPSAPATLQIGAGLLVNSIGMRLARIPDGEFEMGSPASDAAAEAHERPQHRVRIAKPFYLGVCEVTQAEYAQVTGTHPSWFGPAGGAGAAVGDSSLRPVERVSWEDAREFCRRLSERPEERAASRVYRLPTEAEWEYACRAGGSGRFGFGDDEAAIDDHAWVEGNAAAATHPVGQKRPNAWGLYDMHGNVWEWCADWYEPGYYGQSPADNPGGPASGTARVVRGGSFVNPAAACRSAARNFLEPTFQESNGIGFRVVCEADGGRSQMNAK